MGHLDSHVIFNRALFARQSCAVGKRIPLRLQRASYRANNWVTTAQNWCRGSATEIGRKIAKTARDAKMFDATECWEYVATVYRYILPGNLEWIAIHWQMLESAQNWSPNGSYQWWQKLQVKLNFIQRGWDTKIIWLCLIGGNFHWRLYCTLFWIYNGISVYS